MVMAGQEQLPDDTTGLALAFGRLTAGRSLQAALEAGEFIFHRVFNGDRRLLYERGRKCHSLRRLAARPGLGMSVSSLWRAVAVYELSLRFPELVQYEHVGVGHISVVLGLPNADVFRLLRMAEGERWTKRKLQQIAADLRRQYRQSNGPPTSTVVDCLAGVELLGRDAERCLDAGALEPEEAARALDSLARIQGGLAELEVRLRRRLTEATPHVPYVVQQSPEVQQ